MKLVIQIPCFNEAKTLPLVFENMPKQIEGIDEIEYQIIDDGSTDNTAEVARSLGVHHVLTYRGKNRKWLGRAFRMGAENALKIGADILVNTDGDNQYPSELIPQLVRPILEGTAEIVIGDRNTARIKEFSKVKKMLQYIGSKTVQLFSGAKVKDAVSGFRAYSREALLQINVITNYTYTVDTLMQANQKGLDVFWLPIEVNAKTRESRLISSLLGKVWKSGGTILHMFIIYRPFRTFLFVASIFLIFGVFFLIRFAYFYLIGEGDGYVQSVIIGAVSTAVGVQFLSLGIIAELLAVNRRFSEEILSKLKDSKWT